MTGAGSPKTSDEGESAPMCAPGPLDRLNGSTTAVVRLDRMGRIRAVALLVVAILTVSLVGSCGSNPDLAAQRTVQVAQEKQDKARAAQGFRKQVATAMKQAVAQRRAAQQRQAAAQRRAAQQRRAAAQRLARQLQAQAISAAIQSKTVHVSQVLQYFGFSPYDLCSIGPNGGGKAQRQARRLRELRRKQALRYLNLSCPSP